MVAVCMFLLIAIFGRGVYTEFVLERYLGGNGIVFVMVWASVVWMEKTFA